jgi:hypothetical protein
VTGACCGRAKRIEPTGGARNSGPARHRIIEPPDLYISRDLYYLGGSGFGCAGDPGGTLGLVSGVFGGFEEGGAGTSGGEFGSDGDVGDSGVCCVQLVAIAQSAMAARVDLARFISDSSGYLNAKLRVLRLISHSQDSMPPVGKQEEICIRETRWTCSMLAYGSAYC